MIRKLNESYNPQISQRDLPDIFTALDDIGTIVQDTYDWTGDMWTVSEVKNLIDVIQESLDYIKEVVNKRYKDWE